MGDLQAENEHEFGRRWSYLSYRNVTHIERSGTAQRQDDIQMVDSHGGI